MAAPDERRPSSDERPKLTVQQRLAFEKRISFLAWSSVSLVVGAFCLARVGLVVPAGLEALLAPGEYYNLRDHHAPVIVHVVSIFLWSFIGIVQFVPRVRSVALGYHRWAGRMYFVCSVIIVISGLLLSPHAFGGDVGSMLAACVISLGFATSAALGFLRIRQGRVGEHRAWMLRNYAIGSSVVWSRMLVTLGGLLLASFPVFWSVMDCSAVLYELDNDRSKLLRFFPLCQTGPRTPVSTQSKSIVSYITGMRMTYAASLWIGLAINACGVELWIRCAEASA